MTILETKNLIKRFAGVAALDGISLEIHKGEILGLVGPNGSGKSTLINILTGVLPRDGGAVFVGGVTLRNIAAPDMPTYGITRTFQEVRLFSQMSVLDNILVALTERNVWAALFERHRAWHEKRAEEVLRTVELWEKRSALAQDLSYGQRKLLEIGRAIAMDAELLLLDEPFAGLSPAMVGTVKRMLVHLKGEGKTVVLIEHNMDLIRELCGRVIVLDSGGVLAEGEPERVLGLERVVEAYLGK